MSNVSILPNNKYSADDLFQWDYNQTLEIYGLSLDSIPEIHFANINMERAIVRQSTMDERGVIRVKIPNSLLQVATPINVYICSYDEPEFNALYSFALKVKRRTKPSDYSMTDSDEEIYSYNALDNKLNNCMVELIAENQKICDDMVAKNNAIRDDALNILGIFRGEVEDFKDDMKKHIDETLASTSIGNADFLDGHDSSEFALTSVTSEHTLLASEWVNSVAPFENTISVENVTESNHVEIVIPSNATKEQIKEFQTVQIINGTQSDGKLTLRAWGRIPIIDLPIVVIVRGD